MGSPQEPGESNGLAFGESEVREDAEAPRRERRVRESGQKDILAGGLEQPVYFPSFFTEPTSERATAMALCHGFFRFCEKVEGVTTREITALQVQQKNKERVNVHLDGAYAFSVSLLEAARLSVGQRLTEQEIHALQARDEVQRAYDRSLRFLSYRPRSEAEIQRYLQSKGIEEPVREEVLAKLRRLKLIDDQAFACFWVESRERTRPTGRIALQVELRQKGVDEAIIQQALEPMDQEKGAYRAARKRARRYYGLTEAEIENKLGAFLARRGFPYSVAKSTVRRLIEELAAEGKIKTESEETT